MKSVPAYWVAVRAHFLFGAHGNAAKMAAPHTAATERGPPMQGWGEPRRSAALPERQSIACDWPAFGVWGRAPAPNHLHFLHFYTANAPCCSQKHYLPPPRWRLSQLARRAAGGDGTPPCGRVALRRDRRKDGGSPYGRDGARPSHAGVGSYYGVRPHSPRRSPSA